MKTSKRIITAYARMWPREVFDLISGRKGRALADVRELLNHPGVYILYRDEQPYYIGRANRLFKRLSRHALNPKVRVFNFWNYFSAYVVSNKKYLDEVEGILITATANANRAYPRIRRLSLPTAVWRPLREARQAKFRDQSQASV